MRFPAERPTYVQDRFHRRRRNDWCAKGEARIESRGEWLQQKLEATALGHLAEGLVARSQPKLPSHRQLQIRASYCLVLAMIGLGALGYALYTVNREKNRLRDKVEAQQLEDQRRRLEAQKGAGEAKLVHARNLQSQVLAQVGPATNRLT